MANESHNPLSRLLDIDFPDVKKANWNCSYDLQTTASPGFVNVVHTDRILANTHIKMDINQASFANPTISPLYGRYRVKYLAFWAPDRLYIPPWRDGDVMIDDNYPYPVYSVPTDGAQTIYDDLTGNNTPYIAPTSLASDLGIYPAMFEAKVWNSNDEYPSSNALPLLAFWDIYRHYILNPQEYNFPIRERSFIPALTDDGTEQDAINPSDSRVTREDLDLFFRQYRSNYSAGRFDIRSLYDSLLVPLFSVKRVYSGDVDHQSVLANNIADNYTNFFIYHDYHRGKPIAPYGSDMFTSWVSNENVELERNRSKMDVSNGILTMDQWVLASRMQNKVRKSIFKNSSFAEYVDVQYGIKPPTDLTQPMFLGAFVSDIVFNDVVSSVQAADPGAANSNADVLSANQNLGSRAGYGRGTDNHKETFIEFTSREPGTLMVLQIIVPEVFYFEGRDEMYDVQNFNEEFNPAFDGVGFTPLQRHVMNSVPSLTLDPLGRRSYADGSQSFSEYNTSIGQQPYGMRYMAKTNQLRGQMAEFSAYASYALARSFNYVRTLYQTQNSSRADYYSSYIIPEMFQNVFRSSVADNFQFYLNFDYLKYQPISKQFLAFHN